MKSDMRIYACIFFFLFLRKADEERESENLLGGGYQKQKIVLT